MPFPASNVPVVFCEQDDRLPTMLMAKKKERAMLATLFMISLCYLNVDCLDLFCQFHPLDGTVSIELQAVNADLSVRAGRQAFVKVVLVDAVIDNVPLVRAGLTDDRIVCRTVYLLFRILDRDDRVGSYLDRA